MVEPADESCHQKIKDETSCVAKTQDFLPELKYKQHFGNMKLPCNDIWWLHQLFLTQFLTGCTNLTLFQVEQEQCSQAMVTQRVYNIRREKNNTQFYVLHLFFKNI